MTRPIPDPRCPLCGEDEFTVTVPVNVTLDLRVIQAAGGVPDLHVDLPDHSGGPEMTLSGLRSDAQDALRRARSADPTCTCSNCGTSIPLSELYS